MLMGGEAFEKFSGVESSSNGVGRERWRDEGGRMVHTGDSRRVWATVSNSIDHRVGWKGAAVQCARVGWTESRC
jgi:hypothetical protein